MAEQAFAGGKHYAAWDQHVNIEGKGKTSDSDPLAVEATLHFHNSCQSFIRVKGVDEYVTKGGQSELTQAVLGLGAEFPTGAALLAKANTPEGKAEMERKINYQVAHGINDLCIASDGVEITKIKTGDK